MKNISRVALFLFAFAAWIALSGTAPANLINAGVAALVTAWIFGSMFVSTPNALNPVRYFRFVYFLLLLIADAAAAGIGAAFSVISLKNNTHGVVDISTTLTSHTAISFLCIAVTLGADSIAMEAGHKEGMIQVYCMNTPDTGIESQLIRRVRRYETLLARIFE